MDAFEQSRFYELYAGHLRALHVLPRRLMFEVIGAAQLVA